MFNRYQFSFLCVRIIWHCDGIWNCDPEPIQEQACKVVAVGDFEHSPVQIHSFPDVEVHNVVKLL